MLCLGSVGVVSYWRILRERIVADLEGRQGDRWQRCCIIVESFRSRDRALELNMSTEVVRCELYVAVLDVINDTFGKINNALGSVGARVVCSSNGQ